MRRFILLALAFTEGLLLLMSGCQRDVSYQRAEDLRSIPYRPLAGLIPECDRWEVPLGTDISPLDAQIQAEQESQENALQRFWGNMVHRVQSGDTLYRLAIDYYGDAQHWRLIYHHNREQLIQSQDLTPGQLIYLPLEPLKQADQTTRSPLQRPDFYTIAPGDTLYKIAQLFLNDGKKWKQLLDANRHIITDENKLSPGIMITIPRD
ncbi:MAG: LysM peptidoglycan-binding domain-containing protein [Sedimentisphaerales bacterium]|nr:LysM peptidoglycan-binding domain-containing protein [Sedimentisphaerales bacterium]